MTNPLPFDIDDLDRWLDDHTLQKGRGCRRNVQALEWQGDDLIGYVQGSHATPYAVLIDIAASTRNNHSRLRSRCSCPMDRDCKHVAAVLLLALAQAPAGQASAGTAVPKAVQPRAEVLAALSTWHARHASRQPTAARASKARWGLVYVLSSIEYRPSIHMYKARYQGDQPPKLEKRWSPEYHSVLDPPSYMTPEDVAILLPLQKLIHAGMGPCKVDVGQLLAAMVATGRAWVGPAGKVPARVGATRAGSLEWYEDPDTGDGALWAPALVVEEGGAEAIVVGATACYLDPATGEVGPLELPVAAQDADEFLSLPSLRGSEQVLVTQALQQIDPALPHPGDITDLAPPLIHRPVPVLTLHSDEIRQSWFTRGQPSEWQDYATLAFHYGDHEVGVGSTSLFVHDAAGAVHLLARNPAQEAQWKHRLNDTDLLVVNQAQAAAAALPYWQLPGNDWSRMLTDTVPALQSEGWTVQIDPSFRHTVIRVDDIAMDIQPGASGWFDLALDVEVAGRRVALAPLLAQVLAEDTRWLRGQLDDIADDESVSVKTDRNEILLFPAQRLKPVMALLADLLADRGEGLRVPRHDVGRLHALRDSAGLSLGGNTQTQALVQRILSGPAQDAVAPPKGLNATLRDYQLQGLTWLQFLRSHDLGGVLADDMGLGKTLQTLAHLLCEKEGGRLDRPALVVMPTTLIHNWQAEAARFAPGLRVLVLHGPQRLALFDQIPQHDVVLTTYPLVWRDADALTGHAFHMLVLDEAQQVKNPKSRAAVALRAVDSRHHLCLTGTPLENHLGDLWAHFDLLLPGLLGTQKAFNQHWRNPIERAGDTLRARLLAQRLRPFILRRRKQDVASELPPKSLITRSVELEGRQRDLYETVRVTMEKKVREAIASSGLASSHIVVLDALMKLRQVCCDPRLLANATARSAPSAKLELLCDMLPEMVEEGRRILLFSQFTQMLALIAESLDKLGIPFVTLTGDTQDRRTPVDRFMGGEVPVFLISLKAGGVGLNLTTADTVIHFDPWWNPAAENQATDRAHRIGQDKPVFVYKLIAAGSIEERIVALQERKAALADAILDGAGGTAPRFTAEDLDALLAPLPEPLAGAEKAPRWTKRG